MITLQFLSATLWDSHLGLLLGGCTPYTYIQAKHGEGYSYIDENPMLSWHTAVQEQTTWASKIVRMIRKYHNHKL